jgi:hypothetical protein
LDDDEVDSRPRRPAETLQTLFADMTGKRSTLERDGVRNDVYAPFWADLPHVSIFACLTPDLLHQLHKGVFKDHLVEWCTKLAGPDELDARFKAMCTHAGLRHFKKGISVLNFIYYSHFATHSTTTLGYMEAALREFDNNKQIFIEKGVRTHFNIPKLHSIRHYVSSIWTHGTPDGYNTELPERLHINLAKQGYRASNRRNYVTQMVRWLHRQEKIDAYTAYLAWVTPNYEALNLDGDDSEVDEDSETVPTEAEANVEGDISVSG